MKKFIPFLLLILAVVIYFSCNVTKSQTQKTPQTPAIATDQAPFPPNHVILKVEILSSPVKQANSSYYVFSAIVKKIQQRGSGFHYPLSKSDSIKIFAPQPVALNPGDITTIEVNANEVMGGAVKYTYIKKIK